MSALVKMYGKTLVEWFAKHAAGWALFGGAMGALVGIMRTAVQWDGINDRAQRASSEAEWQRIEDAGPSMWRETRRHACMGALVKGLAAVCRAALLCVWRRSLGRQHRLSAQPWRRAAGETVDGAAIDSAYSLLPRATCAKRRSTARCQTIASNAPR